MTFQAVSASAWLLTPFGLRQAEDATAALRQRLDAALEAQRPKKKFGFSAQYKGASSAAATATSTAAQPMALLAAAPVATEAADRDANAHPAR